jgi:ATP-dependent DNA helicase RecG
VSCAWLTGSTPARERRVLCERLSRGELAVLIGTHALFSGDIVFARLALAVVDEQHRFGVAQRERLFEKGGALHGLLMTATPIPRSLALTLYGDLEVSVLRERPPGRGELVTRWAREGAREFERDLETRLERGEQLYWVAPRIDSDAVEGEADEAVLAEDEAQAALGAEQRFARIASRRWSRWGVELAHGRMKSAERAARLERFRRGEARILVATTVIEVGVDVPAASAIVIESCERLGLAQLHQLRGRVGRGAAASVCYLLGKSSARRRLELLERTRDGFEIAEEDLRERGMGDLAGVRQAGKNREGFEPETSDLELIALARTLARAGGQAPGAARPLS